MDTSDSLGNTLTSIAGSTASPSPLPRTAASSPHSQQHVIDGTHEKEQNNNNSEQMIRIPTERSGGAFAFGGALASMPGSFSTSPRIKQAQKEAMLKQQRKAAKLREMEMQQQQLVDAANTNNANDSLTRRDGSSVNTSTIDQDYRFNDSGSEEKEEAEDDNDGVGARSNHRKKRRHQTRVIHELTRTELMESKIMKPEAVRKIYSSNKEDTEALTLIDPNKVMFLNGTAFDEDALKLVPNMTTEQLMDIVMIKRKIKNMALMQRARKIKRVMMLLVLQVQAMVLGRLVRAVSKARAERTLGRLLRPIFLRQRLQKARLRRRHRECPDLTRPTPATLASAVPLFAELAAFPNLLERIIAVMEPSTFDGGEHIIRQGECSSNLYVVATGQCTERATVRNRAAGGGGGGGAVSRTVSGASNLSQTKGFFFNTSTNNPPPPAPLFGEGAAALKPTSPRGVAKVSISVGSAEVSTPTAHNNGVGVTPIQEPIVSASEGGVVVDMPLDPENPGSLRFDVLPSSTNIANSSTVVPLRRVTLAPPSSPGKASGTATVVADGANNGDDVGVKRVDSSSSRWNPNNAITTTSTVSNALAIPTTTTTTSHTHTVNAHKTIVTRDADGRITAVDNIGTATSAATAADAFPSSSTPAAATTVATTATTTSGSLYIGRSYSTGDVFGDVFGVPIPHTCSVIVTSETAVCWRLTKHAFDKLIGDPETVPEAVRRIVFKAFVKHSLVTIPIGYAVHRSVTAMLKVPLFDKITDKLMLRSRFLPPPPPPPQQKQQQDALTASPPSHRRLSSSEPYSRERLQSIADTSVNTATLMQNGGGGAFGAFPAPPPAIDILPSSPQQRQRRHTVTSLSAATVDEKALGAEVQKGFLPPESQRVDPLLGARLADNPHQFYFSIQNGKQQVIAPQPPSGSSAGGGEGGGVFRDDTSSSSSPFAARRKLSSSSPRQPTGEGEGAGYTIPSLVLGCLTPVIFTKGDILFQEGHRTEYVYLLLAGEVMLDQDGFTSATPSASASIASGGGVSGVSSSFFSPFRGGSAGNTNSGGSVVINGIKPIANPPPTGAPWDVDEKAEALMYYCCHQPLTLPSGGGGGHTNSQSGPLTSSSFASASALGQTITARLGSNLMSGKGGDRQNSPSVIVSMNDINPKLKGGGNSLVEVGGGGSAFGGSNNVANAIPLLGEYHNPALTLQHRRQSIAVMKAQSVDPITYYTAAVQNARQRSAREETQLFHNLASVANANNSAAAAAAAAGGVGQRRRTTIHYLGPMPTTARRGGSPSSSSAFPPPPPPPSQFAWLGHHSVILDIPHSHTCRVVSPICKVYAIKRVDFIDILVYQTGLMTAIAREMMAKRALKLSRLLIARPEWLSYVPLFHFIPTNRRVLLAKSAIPFCLPKGTALVSKFSPVTHIILVASGTLRMLPKDNSGAFMAREVERASWLDAPPAFATDTLYYAEGEVGDDDDDDEDGVDALLSHGSSGGNASPNTNAASGKGFFGGIGMSKITQANLLNGFTLRSKQQQQGGGGASGSSPSPRRVGGSPLSAAATAQQQQGTTATAPATASTPSQQPQQSSPRLSAGDAANPPPSAPHHRPTIKPALPPSARRSVASSTTNSSNTVNGRKSLRGNSNGNNDNGNGDHFALSKETHELLTTHVPLRSADFPSIVGDVDIDAPSKHLLHPPSLQWLRQFTSHTPFRIPPNTLAAKASAAADEAAFAAANTPSSRGSGGGGTSAAAAFANALAAVGGKVPVGYGQWHTDGGGGGSSGKQSNFMRGTVGSSSTPTAAAAANSATPPAPTSSASATPTSSPSLFTTASAISAALKLSKQQQQASNNAYTVGGGGGGGGDSNARHSPHPPPPLFATPQPLSAAALQQGVSSPTAASPRGRRASFAPFGSLFSSGDANGNTMTTATPPLTSSASPGGGVGGGNYSQQRQPSIFGLSSSQMLQRQQQHHMAEQERLKTLAAREALLKKQALAFTHGFTQPVKYVLGGHWEPLAAVEWSDTVEATSLVEGWMIPIAAFKRCFNALPQSIQHKMVLYARAHQKEALGLEEEMLGPLKTDKALQPTQQQQQQGEDGGKGGGAAGGLLHSTLSGRFSMSVSLSPTRKGVGVGGASSSNSRHVSTSPLRSGLPSSRKDPFNASTSKNLRTREDDDDDENAMTSLGATGAHFNLNGEGGGDNSLNATTSSLNFGGGVGSDGSNVSSSQNNTVVINTSNLMHSSVTTIPSPVMPAVPSQPGDGKDDLKALLATFSQSLSQPLPNAATKKESSFNTKNSVTEAFPPSAVSSSPALNLPPRKGAKEVSVISPSSSPQPQPHPQQQQTAGPSFHTYSHYQRLQQQRDVDAAAGARSLFSARNPNGTAAAALFPTGRSAAAEEAYQKSIQVRPELKLANGLLNPQAMLDSIAADRAKAEAAAKAEALRRARLKSEAQRRDYLERQAGIHERKERRTRAGEVEEGRALLDSNVVVSGGRRKSGESVSPTRRATKANSPSSNPNPSPSSLFDSEWRRIRFEAKEEAKRIAAARRRPLLHADDDIDVSIEGMRRGLLEPEGCGEAKSLLLSDSYLSSASFVAASASSPVEHAATQKRRSPTKKKGAKGGSPTTRFKQQQQQLLDGLRSEALYEAHVGAVEEDLPHHRVGTSHNGKEGPPNSGHSASLCDGGADMRRGDDDVDVDNGDDEARHQSPASSSSVPFKPSKEFHKRLLIAALGKPKLIVTGFDDDGREIISPRTGGGVGDGGDALRSQTDGSPIAKSKESTAIIGGGKEAGDVTVKATATAMVRADIITDDDKYSDFTDALAGVRVPPVVVPAAAPLLASSSSYSPPSSSSLINSIAQQAAVVNEVVKKGASSRKGLASDGVGGATILTVPPAPPLAHGRVPKAMEAVLSMEVGCGVRGHAGAFTPHAPSSLLSSSPASPKKSGVALSAARPATAAPNTSFMSSASHTSAPRRATIGGGGAPHSPPRGALTAALFTTASSPHSPSPSSYNGHVSSSARPASSSQSLHNHNKGVDAVKRSPSTARPQEGGGGGGGGGGASSSFLPPNLSRASSTASPSGKVKTSRAALVGQLEQHKHSQQVRMGMFGLDRGGGAEGGASCSGGGFTFTV